MEYILKGYAVSCTDMLNVSIKTEVYFGLDTHIHMQGFLEEAALKLQVNRDVKLQ